MKYTAAAGEGLGRQFFYIQIHSKTACLSKKNSADPEKITAHPSEKTRLVFQTKKYSFCNPAKRSKMPGNSPKLCKAIEADVNIKAAHRE